MFEVQNMELPFKLCDWWNSVWCTDVDIRIWYNQIYGAIYVEYYSGKHDFIDV